jgi:hypothetical protein
MIKPLVSKIAEAVDGSQACKFALGVNQFDRLFSNSAFARSSDWITQQLAEAGMVDAEAVHLPADGKTRAQDWTMPLAWECDDAELHMVAPTEELLCSRKEQPLCVAQWSKPTEGKIRGQLHEFDKDNPPPAGAFVLTDQDPQNVMVAATEAGAACVVSDYVWKGYPDDRTMWINHLSTEGGWGLLADGPSLPTFVIPPKLGRRLRELLAQNQQVEMTAKVDGRLGPGTMAVATGVLAGEDRSQEVMVMAHGFEIGVIDNASGVGAVLEAARALGQLIADGKLPRPRRSIRWFITNECYGTVGLLSQRPEIGERGFAGLYLDSVGDASRADYPFRVHRVGAASPGVSNTLIGLIFNALPDDIRKAYHWEYENELPLADHMISDPMVGIPTPWLGRARDLKVWHSSDDVAELIDETNMAAAAIGAAAFAYFVASAGDEEAAWLADAMMPLLEDELKSRVGNDEPDRERFWRWALKRHVLQAARLATTAAGREGVMEVAERWPAEEFVPNGLELDDPRGASLVPSRKVWGTLTFESIPQDKRAFGSPRWSERINGAWFWADGARTVAEIAELTQLELGGKPMTNLTAMFDLAQEAGICTLSER